MAISYVNSITTFWKSLETSRTLSPKISESPFTCPKASSEFTAQAVHWIIENRGGLARIAGGLVIPPQYGPDFETSKQIIEQSKKYHGDLMEDISVSFEDSVVRGVMIYPPDWDKSDTSRCVVYNNPQAVNVAGYIEDNELQWTPKQIFQISDCPLVLFDYRGTGLSPSLSPTFRQTFESIAFDGLKVLEFCINKFSHVDVWGSSMGGGVATVSLDLLLQKKPHLATHFTLTNHDSYTTPSRVIRPPISQATDLTGWIIGGYVGPEASMKRLVERHIPVTILYHDQDPVIPAGARIADCDFIQNRPTVKMIRSPLYGHANLSQDMIHQLV